MTRTGITVPAANEAAALRNLRSYPGVLRAKVLTTDIEPVAIAVEMLDIPEVRVAIEKIAKNLTGRFGLTDRYRDLALSSAFWENVPYSGSAFVTTTDEDGRVHVVTTTDQNGQRVPVTLEIAGRVPVNEGQRSSRPESLMFDAEDAIANSRQGPPSNTLTLSDGTPLQLNGDHLELGSGTAQLDRSSESARVASSSWTGIRSPAEQAATIMKIAPMALVSLEQLIADLQASRINDHSLLDDLRQLHTVIGELIESAGPVQQAASLSAVWSGARRLISMSDDAFTAVTRSPTATIGVLGALGYIFGVDLTTAIFSGVVSGYIKNPQRTPVQ